jgi:hypothetical protein
MTKTLAIGALILLLALVPGARSAAPSVAQTESRYLIAFVKDSGCAFYRNGTEYDAGRAASHLQDKFAAVEMTGEITTAEVFIEKVATRSNLTGRPYEVSCSGQARIAVAQWLRDALVRYRENGASRDSRDAR